MSPLLRRIVLSAASQPDLNRAKEVVKDREKLQPLLRDAMKVLEDVPDLGYRGVLTNLERQIISAKGFGGRVEQWVAAQETLRKEGFEVLEGLPRAAREIRENLEELVGQLDAPDYKPLHTSVEAIVKFLEKF